MGARFQVRQNRRDDIDITKVIDIELAARFIKRAFVESYEDCQRGVIDDDINLPPFLDDRLHRRPNLLLIRHIAHAKG